MKLQPSRIARLKEMITLQEKRAALQREIESIQEQLETLHESVVGSLSQPVLPALQALSASPARAAAPKQSSKAPGKRGSLKETILSALESAGSAGVRVKELAAALGTKPVNIYSWFHSTSKRNPSIIKVSGGHYRLSGKGPESTSAERSPKQVRAVKTTTAPKKSDSPKRGALSEQILNALTASGKEGITLKDLADQVGSKYQNIAIWFSTTGKKNSAIKKIVPGRYRLGA
jgi:hypothetical protein